MKKVILFALVAMFLMSCGGAGKAPEDYITLGQAFSHVAKSFGYWVWIIVVALGSSVFWFKFLKGKAGHNPGLGTTLPLMFATLLLLMIAIFMRPCEVAANTTVEQMLRGVYIGY